MNLHLRAIINRLGAPAADAGLATKMQRNSFRTPEETPGSGSPRFLRHDHAPATNIPGNVPVKAGFTPAVGGIGYTGKQEARMIRLAIRLVTLAVFLMALVTAPPVIPAFAAGGGGDPPSATPPEPNTKANPTRSTHKTRKKPSKQSSFDDPAFARDYRAAYATIYDRNDYSAAIEQLKALGHDDHPNVANLIGYSYRKLGDYKLSQVWYERALKADPNHVLTWQYYGLWQIEQGNRDQAQYHLSRIAAICGTGCEEYRSLAAALEKPPGTGLVY
jgi:Tetratricopeptide repeat